MVTAFALCLLPTASQCEHQCLPVISFQRSDIGSEGPRIGLGWRIGEIIVLKDAEKINRSAYAFKRRGSRKKEIAHIYMISAPMTTVNMAMIIFYPALPGFSSSPPIPLPPFPVIFKGWTVTNSRNKFGKSGAGLESVAGWGYFYLEIDRRPICINS